MSGFQTPIHEALDIPEGSWFLFVCLFVFVRNIGPELTSITPPLFADKDWPLANIHAHLPPLYMGCHHTMV